MEANWPFQDAPSTAVFTQNQILNQSSPVLYVAHDLDEGCWQFLDGTIVQEADARIVSLKEMLIIDPSIAQLADLPMGWITWRKSSADAWQWMLRGEQPT